MKVSRKNSWYLPNSHTHTPHSQWQKKNWITFAILLLQIDYSWPAYLGGTREVLNFVYVLLNCPEILFTLLDTFTKLSYSFKFKSLTAWTKSADVDVLSLGSTFSFPVYQIAIDSGILMRWANGFDILAVVGQDLCGLLQHQIDVQELQMKITALVNDAAGIRMCRTCILPVEQRRTTIRTILCIGTNGVYLENLLKLIRWLEGHPDG